MQSSPLSSASRTWRLAARVVAMAALASPLLATANPYYYSHSQVVYTSPARQFQHQFNSFVAAPVVHGSRQFITHVAPYGQAAFQFGSNVETAHSLFYGRGINVNVFYVPQIYRGGYIPGQGHRF